MKPIEKQADRLFSAFIKKRDGDCMVSYRRLDLGSCYGRLECAHLIRRGFHSIRWDPRNAVALCAGHHAYFTEHPIAWRVWCDELRGPVVMRELLHKAYGLEKVDVAAIVDQLKAAEDDSRVMGWKS